MTAVLVEMEFMNFQTPSEEGYNDLGSYRNIAAYLLKNAPSSLRNLTSGIFSYSLTRPMANKGYYHQIFDRSIEFRTNLESWHTEFGPGVFEAVRGLHGTFTFDSKLINCASGSEGERNR